MKELQKNEDIGNRITFSKEYREKVLLRNIHGLYSKFDLIIRPTNTNTIKLHSEDEEAKKYLDHIFYDINKFVEIYMENGISINGFEIITKNDKFHAVDSKPLAYLAPIIEALKNIIRRESTERKVITPRLTAKNYDFEIYNKKISYNSLEWEEISTREHIRVFEETKYLNVNGLIRISNSRVNYRLESNINGMDTRRQNRISLRFRKDTFTPSQMVNYLKIIELIISDEYKNKVNVSGFIIYFEKNQTEVDTRKRNDEDLLFEWAIRNVLSSDKTIKWVKEADR